MAADSAADTLTSLTLNILLGGFAFLLNGASFLLIHMSRTLPTNQKVVYTPLILSDMCLGFQIMISRCLPFVYTSDHILCHIRLYSGLILAYVTILSNLLITVERFLSLTRPLTTSITWQKLSLCVASFWVISPIVILTTFNDGFSGMPICQYFIVGQPSGYVIFAMTIFIIFTVIFIIYLFIARVVRRHIRQIASTVVTAATINDGRRYLQKAELRSTVTVGIIVGCFGISYIPIATYAMYSALFIDDPWAFMKTNNKIFAITMHFFAVNSLVNPFVYIWRLKSCRQEMIDRFTCKRQGRTFVTAFTVSTALEST